MLVVFRVKNCGSNSAPWGHYNQIGQGGTEVSVGDLVGASYLLHLPTPGSHWADDKTTKEGFGYE